MLPTTRWEMTNWLRIMLSDILCNFTIETVHPTVSELYWTLSVCAKFISGNIYRGRSNRHKLPAHNNHGTWDLFRVINYVLTFYYRYGKVKCTLVQALRLCTGRKAHRGSRGIALLFLDYSTRRGWGVSVTPRSLFTLGKDLVPTVH